MIAFSRKTPPFEYLQEINIKDPFALLSLYVYFKFNCLAKLFFSNILQAIIKLQCKYILIAGGELIMTTQK